MYTYNNIYLVYGTHIDTLNYESLQAKDILNTSNPEAQIVQNGKVISKLIQITEPRTHPLLPNDLQISTRVLSTVISVLEDNKNTTNFVYNLGNVCYQNQANLFFYTECS